ncbi:MAG: hypothetical protein R3F11_26825 [Verrucomicrobiales bacterium]
MLGTEWGPVRLYLNRARQAYRSDRGMEARRSARFWFGHTADFDGDGDLDLAASNMGRNTIYQPRGGSVQIAYANLLGTGWRILESIADHGGAAIPLRRFGILLGRCDPAAGRPLSALRRLLEGDHRRADRRRAGRRRAAGALRRGGHLFQPARQLRIPPVPHPRPDRAELWHRGGGLRCRRLSRCSSRAELVRAAPGFRTVRFYGMY